MSSIHIQIFCWNFLTMAVAIDVDVDVGRWTFNAVDIKFKSKKNVYFTWNSTVCFGRNQKIYDFCNLQFTVEKRIYLKSEFIFTQFSTLSLTSTGRISCAARWKRNFRMKNVMNQKFSLIWMTNGNHGRKGSENNILWMCK